MSIIDCGIPKGWPGSPTQPSGVHTLLRNGHYLGGNSWDLASKWYNMNPPYLFDENREDYKDIAKLIGFDCGLYGIWIYYFNDYEYYAAGESKIYELPDGKDPSNIVGIGSSTKYTYFWFDDGTVSYSTFGYSEWKTKSYTLGKKTRPLQPGESPMYQPSDVVGMAISLDYCYAWYKDGYVSYGRSWDLDSNRLAYEVKIPLICDGATIIQLFQDALGNRIGGNTQFILTRNAFMCPEEDLLKAILRKEKVARENWILDEEGKLGPGLLVKEALLREVYSKRLEPYHYATALLFGDDIEETLYIIALNYDHEFWVIDPITAKVDTNSSIDQSIPESVKFTKIII